MTDKNIYDIKVIYYIEWKRIKDSFFGNTVFEYDALRFMSCLQGVLNRNEPKLYIDFIEKNNADKFWFNYMSQPDKLLFKYEKREITSFNEFIKIFGDDICKCKIALWDSNVPSTMNVAVTACGVDGFLPVRGNADLSLFNALNIIKPQIMLDLVDKFNGNEKGMIWGTNRESTGSRKNDAYIYAIEKYMSETCNNILGFIVDGISWSKSTLYYPDLVNAETTNVDYLVAKKAFVWDLLPYEDLIPGDDLSQNPGTDRKTLLEILQRQYNKTKGEKFSTIIGFLPWACKYGEKDSSVWPVENLPGAVALEWFYAKLFSIYNMFMDADAPGYSGIANCSVFMHYPLKEKYKNNRPKDKKEYNKSKKYIYFYMGDYDASAWTYRYIPQLFTDESRGKFPIGWAFNLNLSDRIPMAFDYIMENKTDNDYFICGDSGAGYLQPQYLLSNEERQNLPGLDGWKKHNKYYYEKFDVSITGFLLNPSSMLTDEAFEAYNIFSHDGSFYYSGGGYINGTTDYFWKPYIYKDVPYMRVAGDVGMEGCSVENTVQAVKELMTAQESSEYNSNFYIFRTILVTPGFIKKVQDELLKINSEFEFPDPFTIMDLIKQAEKLK